MTALAMGLAVLVGISLGLLGGGGSILTVPLLTYVAGMDPKPAIATSLLVVGVTSAFAAVAQARAGRVRWRAAILFGTAAMAGAYVGGRTARLIPGNVLLLAFAVIMVVAGAAMLRGRSDCATADSTPSLPITRIAPLGLAVGAISGLVGAGGGFLLVPALALVAGLSMPTAVGTSLVVISMQSLAGFAGHLSGEQIDWRLAAFVTAAALVGAFLGGRLVAFFDPATLRKIFGWFVLSVASLILGEEVGVTAGAIVGVLTAVAAGMTVACQRYARCPLRGLAHPRHASVAG